MRVDKKNQELAQLLKDADKPIVTPIENPANPGLWVTGDSVILGIRHVLEMNHPIALINARVGRQAPELLEVMLRDGPLALNSPVVFNIGNNNALTRSQVIAIFEAVKLIVIVLPYIGLLLLVVCTMLKSTCAKRDVETNSKKN